MPFEETDWSLSSKYTGDDLAQEAKDAADEAASAASDATEAATAADTKATTAAADASTAKSTATTAKTAADNAASAAATAKTAADTAQSTADTAKTTATTAKTTAEAADTKATEAKDTATEAASSASEANEKAEQALAKAGYLQYDSPSATLTLGAVGDPSKVCIDNDSMDIVVDGETAATFGRDGIELGKSSNLSSIDLCNGSGTIYGASNNGGLVINAKSIGNNVGDISLMVDAQLRFAVDDVECMYMDSSGIYMAGRVVTELGSKLGGTVSILGNVSIDPSLAIDSGGTGADNATDALANLGAAAISHTHSADDITSGTLPIASGGTGATTAAAARTNLGLDVAYCNIASLVTASSGITITAASIRVVNGQIAFLSIGFKKSTATTANTLFNVCTLNATIVQSIALLNMGSSGFADALASGQLRARPMVAYAANAQMYVSGVYLLANEYRG